MKDQKLQTFSIYLCTELCILVVLNTRMYGLTLSSTMLKITSFSNLSWEPRQRVSIVSCRASSLRNKSDFYGVLSISCPEKTEAEEIKKAYRAMALRYHPDVCQDPSMKEESTRMFVLLHEAYKTLSDPVLRSEYDFELGIGNMGQKSSNSSNGRKWCDFSRSRWRDQLSELRKRNGRGTGRKEGSWGSRMREHNRRN